MRAHVTDFDQPEKVRLAVVMRFKQVVGKLVLRVIPRSQRRRGISYVD